MSIQLIPYITTSTTWPNNAWRLKTVIFDMIYWRKPILSCSGVFETQLA